MIETSHEKKYPPDGHGTDCFNHYRFGSVDSARNFPRRPLVCRKETQEGTCSPRCGRKIFHIFAKHGMAIEFRLHEFLHLLG
jgi:hypothetical protein